MRSAINASPTSAAKTRNTPPALTGVLNHSPACTHAATNPPAPGGFAARLAQQLVKSTHEPR